MKEKIKVKGKYTFLMVILIALIITACQASSLEVSQEPSQASEDEVVDLEPEVSEGLTIEKIKETGRIRVGIAVAPPWLLQDPASNKYYGPAIDIVNEAASKLGVEVEFIDTGWDVLVAGLQADKFDVSAAPLFATEERMKVIDFVNYTSAGTCYFVRDDYTKVDSLDDLNDPSVTIVTYTGTGNEQGIQKKYPEATLRSIQQPAGGNPPIEEILAGRGDVGHMDSAIALLIEAKYPDLKVIGGAEECIANPDIPFPIGLGVRKDDPAFKAFFQSIVDSMQEHINLEILKYSDPSYLE